MNVTLWSVGLVAAILYGVAIGSFLNVVIWRVPQGMSVASPVWSFCPQCEHRLGAADLIPLASFLALGRKCRYCRAPISWRYFIVEAVTGLAFLLIYLRFGLSLDTVFYCLFAALLICIFCIDLDVFIIPDELNVWAFWVGLARNGYLIATGPDRNPAAAYAAQPWTRAFGALIPSGVLAAVVCFLAWQGVQFLTYLYLNWGRLRIGRYFLGIADDLAYLTLKFYGPALVFPGARRFVAAREQEDEVLATASDGMAGAIGGNAGHPESAKKLRSREEIASEIENEEDQVGFGQGDVKLVAAVGANLFLALSFTSFFLALLGGSVAGIVLKIAQGKSGRTAMPFGPALVIGAFLALFFGAPLIHWYLGYLAAASSR